MLAYILHFTNVFIIVNGDLDPFDASISKPYIPENNRSVSSISFFLIATAGPPAIVSTVFSVSGMVPLRATPLQPPCCLFLAHKCPQNLHFTIRRKIKITYYLESDGLMTPSERPWTRLHVQH